MTIIIFLVDTSASMLQRTYLGTTYLDYARLAIEQFLKQRQRDPASSGDRYMLMTFEDYPQNIKSGWKESQRIFNEQLKNLKAKGSLKFESCLDSVLRLLLVSRMQSGSGASIEAFGFGRYPSYAEHVVIIPVIDGSSLPLPDSEATVPKPRLLTGSDLFVEGYRWDQRLFPIVLRLPGHLHPFIKQQGLVPPEDNSIAQNFAEQMGGRSFSITLHRALTPCIDHIIQKIQTNGIIIRLQKQGPDPILPNGINENDQSKRDESNEQWKNSLVLIKSKVGQQHSHWPIPEAYWPDSIKTSLPPRNAHPIVVFRCERVEPLFNTDFPLDKYELDSASPLAQFILDVKESNLCWQVFVENSYRQPGLGFPFGYIKISTSATVTLYVMPYNYPELLSLLAMGKDPKIGSSHPQFQHKFEKYLKTVPAYYYSRLKNALSRIKVMPPCLEEANTKLYGYCNLVALQTRIKHQGQQEFESACNAVHKNLQETSLLPPNSASFGGLPGQKIKLQHAEDLHNLPIAKMGIYEEYMKSLNAIGLGPKRELEPQVARPHAFGNPFKLDKKNMSIVDEVGEMNVNSDEPSSSSSISSAERREQRKRERENRASSEGPGSSGQVIARPKRRPGPLDLSRLFAWKHVVLGAQMPPEEFVYEINQQGNMDLVKVSRSRSQLSKGALTSCTFRPAVAPFKSLIPADAFKDTNILLLETPSQTLIPSLQFKNPFDIARENLYFQLDKMRLNFDQQVQTSNLHVLEGGLPGQKIKLQHAEDLHNLPIAKMGIYEEYMKSLNAIGLGPKRELEPQVARPHAFGNPFKLDKKNMSIVDEVGEMNVNSDEPSSSSSISSAERREQRKRERENRASSEGPGSSGQVIARPKRRPGPLDLSRLAAWKNRRRLMRNQNNSNSLATDILEIQSAPPDAQDFEERSKLEEEDLEDQINEEEEEMEEKGFGDDIQYIELDKSQQQQQKANFWGNNKGNSLETTLQEADDFQQPSSSSMPLLDEEEKPKISQNNQRKPFKRPRLDNGETEIPSFTPVIPTISYKEFLQKQRQIRQLCRQIGPSFIPKSRCLFY
uniref:VWFA domain-containing protein n=1 Tax=Meloidogyne incognita TaxID=6306 RepID=A0A914KMR3_MELIC